MTCRSHAARAGYQGAGFEDDITAGLQLAEALAGAGKDGTLAHMQSFTCRNFSATVPPLLQVGLLHTTAISKFSLGLMQGMFVGIELGST